MGPSLHRKEELEYYLQHPEEAIKKQGEEQKKTGYDQAGNHNGFSGGTKSLFNLSA